MQYLPFCFNYRAWRKFTTTIKYNLGIDAIPQAESPYVNKIPFSSKTKKKKKYYNIIMKLLFIMINYGIGSTKLSQNKWKM